MILPIINIAMFLFILYALVIVTREIPQRLILLEEKIDELQASLEEIKRSKQNGVI